MLSVVRLVVVMLSVMAAPAQKNELKMIFRNSANSKLPDLLREKMFDQMSKHFTGVTYGRKRLNHS
jgi:hypothetical protein